VEVFLIAAMSADGFIAPGGTAGSGPSTAWTGAADKKRFVELTKRAKAMVLGRKTFETFGSRPLKGRDIFVLSRSPPGGTKPMVTVTEGAKDGGAGTVEWTNLPPRELVAMLAGRGYAELALCGGSEVYARFLEADLVDRLYLTIEPVLFGDGVPLAAGIDRVNLEFIDSTMLGDSSVLLHYRVA